MLSKFIHVLANGKISFFLWLSSIPLCVCVYHIFFILLLMGTYIASIIFIIVNNTAMNMGVRGYFWISVFTSDVYAGVEMLDHVVVLFLVILETSILFHSGYTNIPTNYVLGFPFSISLPTFVICVLLDDNYSDRYEMIPHCGFHLHFHDDQQYWAFHVLVGHWISFWKTVYSDLLPNF